jgi:hypothetical protein
MHVRSAVDRGDGAKAFRALILSSLASLVGCDLSTGVADSPNELSDGHSRGLAEAGGGGAGGGSSTQCVEGCSSAGGRNAGGNTESAGGDDAGVNMESPGGGTGGGIGVPGNVGTQSVTTCPNGGTRTDIYSYTANYTGLIARVADGPGGPPMTVQSGCTPCSLGQVEIIDNSSPNPLGPQCVSVPPACAAGTYPEWVPPMSFPQFGIPSVAGKWVCTGSCDVLLQYGGMFDYRVDCAVKPLSTMCSGGSVPVFDLLDYKWLCTPICGGTTIYDPATYDGLAVCVPC